MQLKNFSSSEVFIQTSTHFIATICQGKVNVALSGGSTPQPIYQALAQSPIKHTTFFEVDERYVPADHPDSNYRMIREALGRDIIHFDTTLPIKEALILYERQLPASFDLCILGMGPDGHTASLFPHSEALHEAKRLVAHTATDQFPIRDRLTLTFPAIMASKKLLLLLKGKEKHIALNELLQGNKTMDEFPAKKLLEHPDITIHFCTM